MSANVSAVRLVADIGGTNARFALARADAGGRPALSQIRSLHTSDYPTLAAAACDYLGTAAATTIDATTIDAAVFAVASPVSGDTIKITNNPWKFSISELQAELQLRSLRLINDFAAVGYAVPHLGRDDVQAVGGAAAQLASERGDGHYSVLGPGTGLGVGRLLLREGQAIVLETEGGHVGFAPTNPYELKILETLWRERPRVSAERLLSGPGLVNLHGAICAIEGRAAESMTPEQISEQAASDPDGLAARTLDLFCELLGSFAGDTALIHGAWHGVYLAGGITQKILPWIQRGGFRRRFETKGRFEALLKPVPTLAILHPQVGLLGAAAHALSLDIGKH